MKIAARIVNIADGTSFYRGHGPLCELRKTNKEVEVEFLREANFYNLKGYDILFFQRPYHDLHIKEIEAAKSLNIPVVVDYDDDYFNIPTNNDMYRICKQENIDVVGNTKKALELANHIFVSTIALAQAYGLKENYTVINNAYDDFIFDCATHVNMTKNVLWRGGVSHSIDLKVFKEPICQLINEFPDHTFHFLGAGPDYVEKFKNVKMTKLLPVHDYFKKLYSIEPSVVLVPLAENALNASKSNVAKLEALMIGANAVVPNMGEWVFNLADIRNEENAKYIPFTKGVIESIYEYTYKDTYSFYEASKNAIAMYSSDAASIIYKVNRTTMMEEYALSKINNLRLQAFMSLI